MLKVLLVSVLITATCAVDIGGLFAKFREAKLVKRYVEYNCRGKPDCDCSAGSLASGGSGVGACCSKYQCNGGMCIDILCMCLNLALIIR